LNCGQVADPQKQIDCDYQFIFAILMHRTYQSAKGFIKKSFARSKKSLFFHARRERTRTFFDITKEIIAVKGINHFC